MDNSLAVLISDLKTKFFLSFQEEWLPDEKIVLKIGETGSPEAVPQLEEALLRAKRFRSLCEKSQSQMNSGEAGSASPFLAAMLAEQSIQAIQNAIAKCQQSDKA
jgi:hypothetical protein